MDLQTLAMEWTETNQHWLIEVPIRIGAYLLAILIARFILHRMIDRATGRSGKAKKVSGDENAPAKPALLRGLRDRVPSGATGQQAIERRQQRAQTIGSVLKSTVSIVLLVWGILAILNVLGVNIAPFIASAGVVGLAIGFGAQTLIRDIFSGAFFLIDDAFRKGEYIDLGSVKGVVEKISIRSFQLRHQNGPLHTIPFGEIKRLTNYSRDWVIMKLPLRLTYDTDPEKVRKLVKKVGAQLLEDPDIGHMFLDPLKSQGVYQMEDSAMIIRVKFMTRPGDQFLVRKRVYAEIRDLFEREDIHFAHREVTVRIVDDEEGETAEVEERRKLAAGAAARRLLDEEAEAAGKASGPDPSTER